MEKENSDRTTSFQPKEKKLKRILKFTALCIVAIFLAVVIWVGLNGWKALKNITAASNAPLSLWGLLGDNTVDLQGAQDNQINILIIGMGGKNHPGGTLADTIMVASINPKNKTLALISIPRDLYVKIPGNGYGKINSAHSYGEMNSKTTGGGPVVLKKVVAEVLGIPIHYYIRGDFAGFQQLVDELGGVDINVPQAIYDPLFPDSRMQGYITFRVNKGWQHFDGATALKYARSRHSTSDFDRAKRQQQIIIAIKDKVLSVNILTNPKKLVSILNILGGHIQSSLSVNEMQTLAKMAKDFNSKNIHQAVLDNGPDGLLASGGAGGYNLIPKAGIGNYSEIHKMVQGIFKAPDNNAEPATIEVRNATGESGQATDVTQTLENYGYTATASQDLYPKTTTTTLYDNSNGKKPFTLKYLKERYRATVTKQTPQTASNSDFVLILGSDYLLIAKNGQS